MTHHLQQFLTDLYEIDPSLKDHEQTLVPLLEKLLAHDPATAPNPAFVSELRLQLKERVHHSAIKNTGTFDWQRLILTLGGATAVLVAVVIVASPLKKMFAPGEQLFSYSVHEEKQNAFGSLSGIQKPETAPSTITARDATAAPTSITPPPEQADAAMVQRSQANAPMATQGMMAVPLPKTGGGEGDEMGSEAMPPEDNRMILPNFMKQYQFVYNGTLPALKSEVPVYKRIPSSLKNGFSSIASRFSLGSMNLNSFTDAQITSLTLAQNLPYGYFINVDVANGTLAINTQWDQWPTNCTTDEECIKMNQLQKNEVPSDNELVNIATKFLNDHGVDLSIYGKGVVDHQMQDFADQQGYFPVEIPVIFPFIIEGSPTHDELGDPTGISVGVNGRFKKVTYVQGMMNRTYEKSNYEGVTDTASINTYLSNMNQRPMGIMEKSGPGGDANIVQVVLGEPTLAYVTYSRYEKNKNEDLLIPSLLFPITKANGYSQGIYQSRIVVPLAKEMLEQQVPQNTAMPIDAPLPMTE